MLTADVALGCVVTVHCDVPTEIVAPSPSAGFDTQAHDECENGV